MPALGVQDENHFTAFWGETECILGAVFEVSPFMTKLSKYRVLVSGTLSPVAAILSYTLVYSTLTSRSADLEKDWLFRLSLSTLAMAVPFLVTLALTIKDSRRNALTHLSEGRSCHRDSLVGSCLEARKRRHHPIKAIPKPGDAGCGSAVLRYGGS